MTARIRRRELEGVSETDFAFLVDQYAQDLRAYRDHCAAIAAGAASLHPYPAPWTLPIVRRAINPVTFEPDFVIVDSRKEVLMKFSVKLLVRAFIACALTAAIATTLSGQSSPGLYNGQVPTAGQWNSYFAAKQDYLGFAPLNPSSVVANAPISAVSSGGVLTIGTSSIAAGTIVGNGTASPAAAIESTLTSIIDQAACATANSAIVRTTSWGCLASANRAIWATSAAGVPSLTVNPQIGIPGTSTGSLTFGGITSGTLTVQPAAAAGNWTMTLPPNVGTSGFLLRTDGAGVTTWVAAGSGTVTSVTCGTGLTGGTFTTSGTCAVSPVYVKTVATQFFTSSGTYTPTAGLLYSILECVGSGGGGGGVSSGGAGRTDGGGGGGSGSYSRIVASAATIGASQAVTINAAGSGGAGAANGGAGGSTSIGAIVIANGGGGGLFSSGGQGPNGGAGGVAGTGTIAAAGNPGGWGINASIITIVMAAGNGASSVWGGGAAATGLNANGANAGPYGSGGAGGFQNNAATTRTGGNGSNGACLATEFVG